MSFPKPSRLYERRENETIPTQTKRSGMALFRCPHGDSNSSLNLERVASWASRRWGRGLMKQGPSVKLRRGLFLWGMQFRCIPHKKSSSIYGWDLTNNKMSGRILSSDELPVKQKAA